MESCTYIGSQNPPLIVLLLWPKIDRVSGPIKRNHFERWWLLKINPKHALVARQPFSTRTNRRSPCVRCWLCLYHCHVHKTFIRVALSRSRHKSSTHQDVIMSKTSSLMTVLRDYAEASSVHGIAYVFSRSLPCPDRLLWLFCTTTW